MQTRAVRQSPQPTSPVVRVASAGAAGNVLEWFDFAVYGYMAPLIAPLFFPSSDPFSSLLAVYGAFAAGYLARPLGAIVFGHLGDRFGRKLMLVTSVLMMGLCTVGIAFLPTYTTVGPLAGALLVGLRILQGMSVGGEYPGSTVFVVEHAPAERRGFFAAWITSGAIAGFILGSMFVALLSSVFDDAAIAAGVWRVPFLCGALIVLVAFFLRRSVHEPEGIAVPLPAAKRSPVVEAIVHSWRDILKVAGIALGAHAVAFYLLFVYAATFLQERLHVSTATALDINTAALVVLFAVPLASGALSDRVGRRPLIAGGYAVLALLAYPLWWLMHSVDPVHIAAAQVAFALIVGTIVGVTPVAMTEILERATRVSVLSIGYNVTLALFGGTAPLIATYLIARTGDDFVPAYAIMIAAAVSCLVSALVLRRR